MGLNSDQRIAAADLNKRGYIVLPGRNKRPWYSGWNKMTESVTDENIWNMANCFSILTGKKSGLTVIDIDAPDRKWFDEWYPKLNLKPTTTVETPSGGLHLYYKYDSRMKQTQGLGGLAIDVRNDGGQVVAVGSPYDTDKKEKMKYNGEEYSFAKRGEDKLDWQHLRVLDEVWVLIQDQGICKETGEIKAPAPPTIIKKKKKKKKTFGVVDYDVNEAPAAEPREISAEEFMKLMKIYSKHHTGYEAWVHGIWSWCKVAEENDFDAFKWADLWSQQIDGYEGSEPVLAKVNEFAKVDSEKFGYVYIIGQLPAKRKNKSARKFLQDTSKKYYYMDYKKLMDKKDPKTDSLPLELVDDYLRTALLCINKNCVLKFFIRKKDKNQDKWTLCANHGGPFAANMLRCPFTIKCPPSAEEIEAAKKAKREPQPEYKPSSIRKRYEQIFLELPQYEDMVYRQYYGKPAPILETQYNLFTGYKAKEIDEKEMELVQEKLAIVEDCWLTMMCNGNQEMYDYVMNWQAYLIRNGHKKLETFLVFIGMQGTGKNTLWEKFFLDGVLGRQNGQVVASITRARDFLISLIYIVYTNHYIYSMNAHPNWGAKSMTLIN